MGCGCKNKQTQVEAQPVQPSPAQLQTLQQVQTQSVQESVNKVVEKYYKK